MTPDLTLEFRPGDTNVDWPFLDESFNLPQEMHEADWLSADERRSKCFSVCCGDARMLGFDIGSSELGSSHADAILDMEDTLGRLGTCDEDLLGTCDEDLIDADPFSDPSSDEPRTPLGTLLRRKPLSACGRLPTPDECGEDREGTPTAPSTSFAALELPTSQSCSVDSVEVDNCDSFNAPLTPRSTPASTPEAPSSPEIRADPQVTDSFSPPHCPDICPPSAKDCALASPPGPSHGINLLHSNDLPVSPHPSHCHSPNTLGVTNMLEEAAASGEEDGQSFSPELYLPSTTLHADPQLPVCDADSAVIHARSPATPAAPFLTAEDSNITRVVVPTTEAPAAERVPGGHSPDTVSPMLDYDTVEVLSIVSPQVPPAEQAQPSESPYSDTRPSSADNAIPPMPSGEVDSTDYLNENETVVGARTHPSPIKGRSSSTRSYSVVSVPEAIETSSAIKTPPTDTNDSLANAASNPQPEPIKHPSASIGPLIVYLEELLINEPHLFPSSGLDPALVSIQEIAPTPSILAPVNNEDTPAQGATDLLALPSPAFIERGCPSPDKTITDEDVPDVPDEAHESRSVSKGDNQALVSPAVSSIDKEGSEASSEANCPPTGLTKDSPNCIKRHPSVGPVQTYQSTSVDKLPAVEKIPALDSQEDQSFGAPLPPRSDQTSPYDTSRAIVVSRNRIDLSSHSLPDDHQSPTPRAIPLRGRAREVDQLICNTQAFISSKVDPASRRGTVPVWTNVAEALKKHAKSQPSRGVKQVGSTAKAQKSTRRSRRQGVDKKALVDYPESEVGSVAGSHAAENGSLASLVNYADSPPPVEEGLVSTEAVEGPAYVEEEPAASRVETKTNKTQQAASAFVKSRVSEKYNRRTGSSVGVSSETPTTAVQGFARIPIHNNLSSSLQGSDMTLRSVQRGKAVKVKESKDESLEQVIPEPAMELRKSTRHVEVSDRLTDRRPTKKRATLKMVESLSISSSPPGNNPSSPTGLAASSSVPPTPVETDSGVSPSSAPATVQPAADKPGSRFWSTEELFFPLSDKHRPPSTAVAEKCAAALAERGYLRRNAAAIQARVRSHVWKTTKGKSKK